MPFSTAKVCVTVPANHLRVSEISKLIEATMRRSVQAEPVRDRVRYVGLVLATDDR